MVRLRLYAHMVKEPGPFALFVVIWSRLMYEIFGHMWMKCKVVSKMLLSFMIHNRQSDAIFVRSFIKWRKDKIISGIISEDAGKSL